MTPGSREPNSNRMITPRMISSIGPGIDKIANILRSLIPKFVDLAAEPGCFANLSRPIQLP